MFFVAAVKVQQKQSDVNRNLQVRVSIKNKSLYFFFSTETTTLRNVTYYSEKTAGLSLTSLSNYIIKASNNLVKHTKINQALFLLLLLHLQGKRLKNFPMSRLKVLGCFFVCFWAKWQFTNILRKSNRLPGYLLTGMDEWLAGILPLPLLTTR